MLKAFFCNGCRLLKTFYEHINTNDHFFFHLLTHDERVLFQFESGWCNGLIGPGWLGALFRQFAKIANDGIGEFGCIECRNGFIAEVTGMDSLFQGVE